MSIEWSQTVVERARAHAALGEPARLAIVDRLLVGDASPTEISRALELPSNLLAHHLKLLEQAGLVARCRSEGDQRRTYLRLNLDTLINLGAFGPTGGRTAPRVVFVCTRNSARSPLAAALWKGRSRVPVASAGIDPAERVDPRALDVAAAHGLSLTVRTRHVGAVVRADDLVVAVCDAAHEQLDSLLAVPSDRLHWSVPDPAGAGTQDAFELALSDLTARIDRLVPVVQLPRSP
ncbi:helix-turn-helix domain-containing protein [Fodinicola acaciae]|uniref:arsenate reductase/protein-tyrosine-phosphatase family protein n=1 Tax=Fodinicola acaciae TaxID=2681555 RepID=UPI0013D09BCF|nr:helix-turn-helix domain-containing protein [Fodinicola acaciae]